MPLSAPAPKVPSRFDSGGGIDSGLGSGGRTQRKLTVKVRAVTSAGRNSLLLRPLAVHTYLFASHPCLHPTPVCILPPNAPPPPSHHTQLYLSYEGGASGIDNVQVHVKAPEPVLVEQV